MHADLNQEPFGISLIGLNFANQPLKTVSKQFWRCNIFLLLFYVHTPMMVRQLPDLLNIYHFALDIISKYVMTFILWNIKKVSWGHENLNRNSCIKMFNITLCTSTEFFSCLMVKGEKTWSIHYKWDNNEYKTVTLDHGQLFWKVWNLHVCLETGKDCRKLGSKSYWSGLKKHG